MIVALYALITLRPSTPPKLIDASRAIPVWSLPGRKRTLQTLVSIVYHLVAAAALIGGGSWAYFKFIRNRTLKRRLTVGVEGRLVTDRDKPRLVVRCRAENVGLRDVTVGGEGTSLRVYFYGVESEGPPGTARLAEWQWLNSWPIFETIEGASVVESEEALEEQLLLELPRRGFAALRLELVVHAPPESAWEVSEVVVLRPGGDSDHG